VPLLGLMLAVAACDGPPAPEPGVCHATRGGGRPNVILVVLCSLRFDHTGLGGYHRATTPFLDTLAGGVMLPYRLRARVHQARRAVERASRRVLFGSVPSWKRQPNVLPWFDQPDALARIAGEDDGTLLEKWVRDGYVVVDDCVDVTDVEAMVAILDGLWDADRPIPDLVLLGLREARDVAPRSLAHRDLLPWIPPPAAACGRRPTGASTASTT